MLQSKRPRVSEGFSRDATLFVAVEIASLNLPFSLALVEPAKRAIGDENLLYQSCTVIHQNRIEVRGVSDQEQGTFCPETVELRGLT